MLAHGNRLPHFVTVLGASIVDAVEALAPHGVTARLVPTLFAIPSVMVPCMRVLPAVELLAVNDHLGAVDDHIIVACAVAGALHVHAVPTHVHFLALLGVFHVHAVAPRHVHVLVSILHVNPAGTDVHLALLAGRCGFGSARRIGGRWRGICRGSRRSLLLGLALSGAIGRLERDVVADLFVDVQQIVQRQTVQLSQRDEVVGVGGRLGALPLRHGLPRHAQTRGKRLLRKPRLLAALGQALRDLYVHGVLPFSFRP